MILADPKAEICDILYYSGNYVEETEMGKTKLFTAEMLAPCGLDCSICSQAHSDTNPCPGCNGPNREKPVFCAMLCGIVKCKKRKAGDYQYCDECPDFPCAEVMEKETRYTSAYPLSESPLNNLRMMRDMGMDAFLDHERDKWMCKRCGGAVSVHTGCCGKCGEKQ